MVTGHTHTTETLGSHTRIPTPRITPLFMSANQEGQDCVAVKVHKLCAMDRKACRAEPIPFSELSPCRARQ